MTDATLGQVIVAVTALASGSLGFASGLLIEHLRSQRDRTARAEARQNLRDDVQRDNLLGLQTAVARFARVVGRAHHHDTIAFKATGKWASTLLGQQLDDEYLDAQVQLQVLTERARDDELRRLIIGFKNRGVLVTSATSDTQAQQRMDDWIERMGEVQDRLGTVLRGFM